MSNHGFRGEPSEFSLDLSTVVRGLTVDPEFIASLPELGECVGG